MKWEPQHKAYHGEVCCLEVWSTKWQLISEGKEGSFMQGVSIESVNLISATRQIITNRRWASCFPYFLFSFHSPSWSRVSLAVTFMSCASWAHFINSIESLSYQWLIFLKAAQLCSCVRIRFPFICLVFTEYLEIVSFSGPFLPEQMV